MIVAALIDGLSSAIIHYDFSGADALLILPPLAVLGFMFCLVYEKTGSLWPVVGLHAFNNAIAYGVAVEDASVSLVLGPLMLAACIKRPGVARSAPRGWPWHSGRHMSRPPPSFRSRRHARSRPATAQAQTPTPPTTTPPPRRPPKPVAGKASISVLAGAREQEDALCALQEVLVRGPCGPTWRARCSRYASGAGR